MKQPPSAMTTRVGSASPRPPAICSIKSLLLVVLAACASSACSTSKQEAPRQSTPAEKPMVSKLGDTGYRLIVDASKGDEFVGVTFYEIGRPRPIYMPGWVALRGRSGLDMSGPVPEKLRVQWRDSDKHGTETKNGTTYIGNIIGDEVVEAGSRIPQELIDDLKRDPRGGLRLKIRMSRHGTMVGWDIARGGDYSFAGGDFREAEIFNGKVVRPGWYIDRKTGRKIETDY